MSCYHPLFRLPAYSWESLRNQLCPLLDDDGRHPDVTTVFRLCDRLGVFKRGPDGSFDRAGAIKGGAVFVHEDEADAIHRLSGRNDFVQSVPCGQCIGCRVSHAEEWAYRIMCEAVSHGTNTYFLTMTYDDMHVPTTYSVNPRTCTPMVCYPLVKKDFQDFMKRLRFHYGEGIRFFACGEYGDSSGRCHFHAILLGLNISDLLYLKKCHGHPVFNSPTIDALWGKGFTVIGSVTSESALYCAKYCMKKRTGQDRDKYLARCVEEGLEPLPPEFVLMSRRPGLGRTFYEEKRLDLFQNTRLFLPGGKQVRQPRYFENLFKFEDPATVKRLKLRRQQVARAKVYASDLSAAEQRRVNERVFLSSQRSRTDI